MGRLVLLSSLAVSLVGCVGITIKKDQVSAAKRVAIVGYEGDTWLQNNNVNKNAITAIAGASKAAADISSGKREERRHEQGVLGYGELAKRLNTQFGWEIIGRDQFASVAPYQDKVASRKNGKVRGDLQTVEGVLTRTELDSLKPEELAAIAQGLNADALVLVKLNYAVAKTGGVTIGGFGSQTRYLAATARFKVLDKNGQVIWDDPNARGATTSQGLRETMGANIVENETEVLSEAANSSFDVILQHYQTYEEKK